ncbi:PilZ domain-containing protein [Saccharophagus sp. K07]|jgi:bifunctional N-acetylglucosamine-1-phosphate-uridyltransferase/glucosamine-1-phosphate-acetyltransferase GlmU-like protein|uniref:PilZ domain-containing protein n=1 Tax=Saccharophagus sp. K07 TaxID=2283636 RepID=UPI00165239FD|nr:PilZ domain-containing protein [Saccharophagus sp. K07]MBC6904012.1 PilZ domain-containing protein [Saccharophagus sp. K07]
MEKTIVTPERRNFSRIPFDGDVRLLQEGKQYQAQLQDISVNGVLISTPADYHLRTDIPCTLQVTLADDVIITMQVTLVHSSSAFLGFHCTSIDMDSMVHLRRLIEINLGEPGAAERVLAELLKRHQQ